MTARVDSDSTWWTNRQRKVTFNEKRFESFVKRVGRDVAGGKEFAVVIGSDAALRAANQQFRGKPGTTDVLSFPDGEDGRLGDILISAARAAKQADQHGHSVDEELKVLVLHGLLHLLGYDHESDDGKMQRAETRWRKKLGLPNSLTERATQSETDR